MSDNKGYALELIELRKQLLEHVYVQGLQSIYDRVEKKFNKDAHNRAQQAKGDINSDKRQMDSAIVVPRRRENMDRGLIGVITIYLWHRELCQEPQRSDSTNFASC